jgi:autotransporter-associated beta strand protein
MPNNRTSTVDIDGAGGLTKEGTGVLFLTGDLDYTGATTITEGTLSLGSIVTGDIVNDDALQFDLAVAETYSGIVSGTGTLEKTGVGNLTVDGLNTYTGATIVNEGTLTLVALDDNGTQRFSIEGDITIQTDGNLAFNIADATTETFDGAIDGAGTLIKNGAGTLVLTGANTSTGAISLNLGQLEGTSSSIAGDVVLSNGTVLVFSQDFDGSFAGDLSSPAGGTVVKDGTGNLRLIGSNAAFPGTLQLNAGTLTGNVASLPNDIQNDATLVFDQATDATYGGVIANGVTAQPGAVQKTGAGTLSFTMDQTYTGPTTIGGGRLDVNGSLASAVTVSSGATLGGIGMIAAPVVANGRVAPGNSVGTLDVNQASFSAGSSLEVEIESAASADRLDIAGNLDIQAGARVVPVFANLANPISDLPIVTSGGRTGTFEVDGDLAFQTVSLAHVGNDVEISIAFGDIFSGANTPNQLAVATALDNASNDGTANELDDAIATLRTSSLSSAAGARALDEIGPEAVSQLGTARLALDQRIGDNVQRRVRTVLSGGAAPLFGSLQPVSTTQLAGAPSRPLRKFGASTGFGARSPGVQLTNRGGLRSFEPEAGSLGVGGWLDGYGGFGTLDGDSGTADADYALAGATLGLDYRLTPNVLVGVGGGWGFTDLEVDDRSADGEAHTFHGLAYAGYATPQFHLALSGRYGFSQMETTRRIAFATVTQTADGDFDGDAYGGRLEAGVNIAELYGVLFQPIAHLDLSHIEQDGYRESGSPAFDLKVDSESIDSQITSFGLRIHGTWALPEDTGSFEPELSGRWEHQFGDDDREITGALLGDGSATPIALRGAETPTDRYLVHLGWVVSSETGLRATLGYTGAFSSEQMEHGGALSVQYTW